MSVSLRATREQGDTLVEVLVAISVLAVVIVGTFSLMNKGLSQMYDTMEKSQVRSQVNRQVEALTYARDQYLLQQGGNDLIAPYDTAAANLWASIRTFSDYPSGVPGATIAGCSNTSAAFAITADASGVLQLTSGTYIQGLASEVPVATKGLWMQKRHTAGAVPYTDFYIRACWNQNSSPSVQIISTVVRLYDKN